MENKDLNSSTRDQTLVPALGLWSLNHCIASEVRNFCFNNTSHTSSVLDTMKKVKSLVTQTLVLISDSLQSHR